MDKELRIVRLAALAYTANFLAGIATAIRGGYRAEPIGIRTRIPIAADAIVGNGSALSAPPALMYLWWKLLRNSARSRIAKGQLVLLASAFLAGAVAEPLSHRILTRGLPKHVKAIGVLNIALPAAMLVGTVKSLADPETPHTP
ncbi:MAG: hypothetical protein ACR2ME_02190 [Acidimicrobiia bacterium]